MKPVLTPICCLQSSAKSPEVLQAMPIPNILPLRWNVPVIPNLLLGTKEIPLFSPKWGFQERGCSFTRAIISQVLCRVSFRGGLLEPLERQSFMLVHLISEQGQGRVVLRRILQCNSEPGKIYF